MKLRHILVPIMATAVGLSFLQGSAMAAAHEKNELAIQPSFKFTGRVQGYYRSDTSKTDGDADSVTSTTFVGVGRFGVQGSASSDAWKSRFKLETDVRSDQDVKARDAYVAVGNESFEVRVGRFYSNGNLTVITDIHLTQFDHYVNDVGGRNSGIGVNLKGLPVGVDFDYKAYESGVNDVSEIHAYVNGSAANIKWGFEYGSKNTVENEDRTSDSSEGTATVEDANGDEVTVVTSTAGAAGDSGNTTSQTTISVLGRYTIDAITLGLGLGTNTEVDDGADTNSSGSTTALGVDYSLGDMGVLAAGYVIKSDKDDDADDATVKTSLVAGWRNQIGGGPTLRIGYYSKTTDIGGEEGASSTNIAAGFQYGF